MIRPSLPALLLFALAAAPTAALAQSYRCVGKDGKKHYGQSIPPQCVGQPVEQLGHDGRVVRRIDAQASADEQKRKEAEAAEAKKREAVLKEETRRNKALLSTYTSEADVDRARQRALEDNQKAVKETEGRIATLRKREVELKKEMEFFTGKNKPPAKLEQEIRDNQFSIQTQEQLLGKQTKDVDGINLKFDEDKRRYVELTRSGKK
jgi:hypothetical protein